MKDLAEMLYILRLLVSEFEGSVLTASQEKALHLARLSCAKQSEYLNELANSMEDAEVR